MESQSKPIEALKDSDTSSTCKPSDPRTECFKTSGEKITVGTQTALRGKFPKELEQTHLLAKDVADFLHKIAPWEGIMPSALRLEMEHLVASAAETKGTGNPDEPSSKPPEWDPVVAEYNMESWRRTMLLQPPKPAPVIAAYYRTLGPPKSLGTSATHTLRGVINSSMLAGDQRNLQRVKIISQFLHDEFETATSTSLQWPIIIAPPYKPLLEFQVHFKERQIELEAELAGTTRDQRVTNAAGQRPSSPTLSDTSESDTNSMLEAPVNQEEDVRDVLRRRIAHLQCLNDFTDRALGDLIAMRSQLAAGTLERIAFEDLWHLFKPGDLVVSRVHGKPQLHKVYSVTGGQVRRRLRSDNDPFERRAQHEKFYMVGTWSPFTLNTFIMGFDGSRIGPKQINLRIMHYSGKRAVAELPVFPVRYHPHKQDLVGRLEDRGRAFMSSFGHMHYEGVTTAAQDVLQDSYSEDDQDRRFMYYRPSLKDDAEFVVRSADIVSEVYVDFEAYFKSFPLAKPRLGSLNTTMPDPTENSEAKDSNRRGRDRVVLHLGYEIDTMFTEHFMAVNRGFLDPIDPANEPLTPEHYQLLPHWVPGFSFRHRQWYLLDIAHLRPIDTNRYTGFKDLVIPEHYKTMLVALVDSHTSGVERHKEKLRRRTEGLDKSQVDLVPGKGQGLIILLHGPPGSGKTSTAETIAAYTGRPLYSITCGDIGLVPKDVEKELDEHTSRADKWGCVLLLDEADVFLMQRTWKELARNALVSVFLRQLEYYSGILFLTTNRPGTIDEAFKSRIHVSLRYPGIDLQSTKQMWENIMRRLEAENEWAEVKVEFDRQKLLAFAEQHFKRREQQSEGSTWNGRQIRNAFQTALALGHASRQEALREAGKTAEWAASGGPIRRKKWMTVKLTTKNFRSIARTTREFEDYIVHLRGKDSEAARDAEVRDDDYDPDLPMKPARKNYSTIQRNNGGGGGGGRGGGGMIARSDTMESVVGVKKGSAKKRQESHWDVDSEADEDDDDDEEDDDGGEDEDEEEEDDEEEARDDRASRARRKKTKGKRKEESDDDF